MMTRQLFALHDEPQKAHGMFPVAEEQAFDLNRKGFGIFWEVNDHFPKGQRSQKYLKNLLSFYCEFDGLTKGDQLKLIEAHIPPSLLIESKRGFHAYWQIHGLCSIDAYNEIQRRIIEFYGGDKNAKDTSRVLRAPGFNHMKDPKNPFRVRVAYRSRSAFSSKEMTYYFPKIEEPKKDLIDLPKGILKAFGDTLTQRIDSISNEDALLRLSGTEAVNFERFSFKDVSGGKKNIFVNDKGTSCWIDEKGRIGSHSGGGPTFAQFVNWYHRNWQVTFSFLKQYIPEVFDGCR